MKEKKDEMFSKLEVFYLGILIGSIIGNALMYFLIDYLI
jgi:hypothetical protein